LYFIYMSLALALALALALVLSQFIWIMLVFTSRAYEHEVLSEVLSEVKVRLR
jgi:hypothetical protein